MSPHADSPRLRSPRLQLGIVCAATFVVWAGFGAILPYLPVFLQEEAHASVGLIGVIAAAASLGALLFASPLGALSDRIGRKPVLLGGVCLYAVSTLLFVTTTHPGWFIFFRFLEGVATGAVMPAGQAFVADITDESTRSRAYGWFTTAQFGGLVAGPGLAVPLYALGGGSGRWAFYTIFLFGSGLAVLTAIGLAVILREPARAGRRPADGAAVERPPYRRLLTPAVLAFLVVAGATNFAMGSWEVVWSLYLRSLGASMTFVGLTWMAFSFPMLLAFVGGWLADRYSRFRLMYTGFAVACVVWIAYGLADHLGLFLALSVVEGLATAVALPAKQAFLVQVSPARWLGAIQGLEASVMQAAALMGILVAPALYGWIGGRTISIGGAVGLAGILATAPILSREWQKRRREVLPAAEGPPSAADSPRSAGAGSG